jgi:hypothetical protein
MRSWIEVVGSQSVAVTKEYIMGYKDIEYLGDCNFHKLTFVDMAMLEIELNGIPPP